MDELTIKAFNALAKDIFELFYNVLNSDVGINKKVGKNTLKDSRLQKTMEMDVDLPYIKIMVNEYIDSIEKGRPRGQTPKVSISALKDWAKRKGIPSDNKTLYLIQNAIYRDGIEGRPVIKTFYDMLEKEWDELIAETLFDTITYNLTKYFNQ